MISGLEACHVYIILRSCATFGSCAWYPSVCIGTLHGGFMRIEVEFDDCSPPFLDVAGGSFFVHFSTQTRVAAMKICGVIH